MGGASYDIKNPVFRLRLAASSCFFGEPQYYATEKKQKTISEGNCPALNTEELSYLRDTLNAIDPKEWRSLTPRQLMEKAIDEALNFNAEETLKEADRLRNKENIRITPQVIMVRAANNTKVKGTTLISTYASKIIKRGDEPAVQLAYQLDFYGKDSPIPNSLKRAWRKFLETADKYQLAKYKMESRAIKTIDVINLTHPKSDVVSLLAKGELKLNDDLETWESLISREGSTKETWTKAIKDMGHMALLRNLRNLLDKEIDSKEFMPKLVEGVAKGKQLPFRYYSAYKAVENKAPPTMLDQIEECLIKSFENSPKFGGRIMALCDNSGSARGTCESELGTVKISDIANLTAVMTGYMADEGYVGIFGDRLETMPIRKKSSVFDQLKQCDRLGSDIGASTETGIWLFWDRAIKNKEYWDMVFIYSDMQAGHGRLYGNDYRAYSEFQWPADNRMIDVPKLISKYRAEVNPNVLVFCVQVAGYQDTIIPEFFPKTYMLGGWGNGIFQFVKEMADLEKPKQTPLKQ
jgi:hypothetical protein